MLGALCPLPEQGEFFTKVFFQGPGVCLESGSLLVVLHLETWILPEINFFVLFC